MPTVLPIGLGLGVVGVSTFGHDIAGERGQARAEAELGDPALSARGATIFQ
jgi:hypothetical protein